MRRFGRPSSINLPVRTLTALRLYRELPQARKETLVQGASRPSQFTSAAHSQNSTTTEAETFDHAIMMDEDAR